MLYNALRHQCESDLLILRYCTALGTSMLVTSQCTHKTLQAASAWSARPKATFQKVGWPPRSVFHTRVLYSGHTNSRAWQCAAICSSEWGSGS